MNDKWKENDCDWKRDLYTNTSTIYFTSTWKYNLEREVEHKCNLRISFMFMHTWNLIALYTFIFLIFNNMLLLLNFSFLVFILIYIIFLILYIVCSVYVHCEHM